MTTTEDDTLEVVPDGGGEGITRVLLDRPPANAMDLGAYQRLLEVVRALTASPPRALQLGSKIDRFFCGGRDLKEPAPATAEAVAERQETVSALYDTLLHLPCPTIAVMDGYALGTGLVMASVCDIRVATERSVFGLPEVKAGSVGGARHLMRLLPHAVVRRMALTAEPIGALEAARHGMVELVDAGQDPWEEADRIAGVIASFDTDMVERVKRALDGSEELPLAEGVALEHASRRAPDARCAG